jgi:hypothetical protein
MHHAREPASNLMNLYIILYLLNKHTHNDNSIKELLSTVNVYFIPVINIDGYIENNKRFIRSQDFEDAEIRKNRRTGREFAFCGKRNGVDLNRNYGYQWGFDDLGSSTKPCSLTYRGKSPFSEPETQAIKQFIEKHSDIKVAYNYHSYGNMLLTPFMYLRNAQEEFNKEYEKEFKIYNEFFEEADLPPDAKTGNGYKVTGHSSGNGEASDWMLGEKRIIAFSPEIGNNDKGSFDFYPDLDLLIDVVLKENLPPALYAIQRSSYFLRYEILSKTYIHCDKAKLNVGKGKGLTESLCKDNLIQYESVVKLKNTGFGKHGSQFIPELLLNTALIDAAVVIAEKDGKVIFTNEFKLVKEEEEFQSITTDHILEIDESTLKVIVLVDKDKQQNKEQILFMLFKKITGEHKFMFNNPYIHQEFNHFEEGNYEPVDEGHTSIGVYIAIGVAILLVISGAIVLSVWRKRRRRNITNNYMNMNQL